MNDGGYEYLHDMTIAQIYATVNREAIATTLLKHFFKCPLGDQIHTAHNYYNYEDNIIRKGAIQADRGRRVVIPLNMRDGVIVGYGKGNPDWNESAPHGAGRIMGRSEAKRRLSMASFQADMEGIYSECVDEDRLDEAPGVYKDAAMIQAAIADTVDIEFVMQPIFNYKGKG